MNDASQGGSQPAKRPNTLLWIALAVFGIVGLSLNAFMRPEGMAKRFAVVTKVERVLVEETAPAASPAASPDASSAASSDASSDGSPDGSAPSEAVAAPAATAKRKWVAPDDAGLAAGTLRRVDGVEPITWETRESVKAAEAELLQAEITPGGPVRIDPSPIDSLGIWVAALLTLFILSFVYRDNPFYKVAESILIGVSAAYWMVVGFWSTLVPQLFGALMPDVVRAHAMPSLPVSSTPGLDAALAFVPLLLGFMLLWRLAPKGGWISVWPIAFVIGTTAGIRLVGAIEADLMRQLVAAMKPLVVFENGVGAAGEAVRMFDFWGTVGSVVGVVGVLSVLTYFFFSVEHKGAVGKTARVGIWFLMISFGSAFGLTVMGRITLLLQRFEFLFTDWLNI
jgi:hypothetical protein